MTQSTTTDATTLRIPAELLPSGWRGRQAHDLFLTGFGLLRGPAVAHYHHVLQASGEPVGSPPARNGS